MDDHQTLANRLERLERECDELKRQARRWRRAGGTVLAAIALLVVGGAWQVDDGILKVRGVVIEDGQGKERIGLRVTDRGPLLMFKCDNGTPRLLMGVGGGPNPSDKPFLNMRNEKAEPRILMGLSDSPLGKGAPYLNIRGDDGKVIFQAPQPKAAGAPTVPPPKKGQDAGVAIGEGEGSRSR
jgi:hypothetical protein